MLDLKKFSKNKEVILPIVDGWGQFDGRRVYKEKEDNGWFLVRLGDIAKVLRRATPLEVEKSIGSEKKLRVFALGEEGVPLSFDRFNRLGLKETEKIYFLDLPIFSVANVIQWEDGRLYYYGQAITKEQSVIREVHNAFNENKSLSNLRGVTPELRFYFLLVSLQKQSFEAIASFKEYIKETAISKDILQKKVNAFRLTFSDRLKSVVEQAGGEFVSLTKRGNYHTLQWKIGGQTIKSNIRDNMQIISAGFCLNDDDKLHTVGSLVKLAEMFQEEDPLYITRD